MRSSDWSSDVCSSDLEQSGAVHPIATVADHRLDSLRLITELILRTLTAAIEIFGQQHDGIARDIRFAAKQRCRPLLDGGLSTPETRIQEHQSPHAADPPRAQTGKGSRRERESQTA